MIDPQTVGVHIRRAREACGLNRNQLAQRLGTSWKLVNQWETGRTLPSPSSLYRLAEVLDVTTDYLLSASLYDDAPSGGFAAFLESYAPDDLTEAELRWLSEAPVTKGSLAPEDYAALVRAVRRPAIHLVQRPGQKTASADRAVDTGT